MRHRRRENQRRTDRDRSTGSLRGAASRSLFLPGFVLLAVAKALDVLTTAVGLYLVPTLVERNPVARAVVTESGVLAGLVFFGGLLVVVTATVVELGAMQLSRHSRSTLSPVFLRLGSYGTLSFVYIWTAFRNARLVVDTIGVEHLLL